MTDFCPKPYWMVHSPTQGPARMQHFSREEAEGEAKRLARISPGHVFYVLQAVSAQFLREPIERVEFEIDEVPF